MPVDFYNLHEFVKVELVTDAASHVSTSCCISSEHHACQVSFSNVLPSCKLCLKCPSRLQILCNQGWSLCDSPPHHPHMPSNGVGAQLLFAISTLENVVNTYVVPFQIEWLKTKHLEGNM